MLFFYNKDLKNDIEYLKTQNTNLLNYFNSKLYEQNAIRNILLLCMSNIADIIDNIENTQYVKDTNILFNTLDKIRVSFTSIDYNIQNTKSFIDIIKEIDNILGQNLLEDSLFLNIDKLNSIYESSRLKVDENISIVYEFLNYYIKNCNFNFESFIIPTSQELDKDIKIDINQTESSKNNANSTIDDISNNQIIESNSNIDDSNKNPYQDNNILLISEKDNVAYLPYKSNEIEDIFNAHPEQYETFQDVIDMNFTVSLDRFKNPVIARFREAFSLMRNKEHASLPKCLDLALELSFNSLLNPIIICACNSLDELDIYLDFLETNELDKFNIFEVKYEVTPLLRH